MTLQLLNTVAIIALAIGIISILISTRSNHDAIRAHIKRNRINADEMYDAMLDKISTAQRRIEQLENIVYNKTRRQHDH